MALHNEKMRFAQGCGVWGAGPIGKTARPSSLNPTPLHPPFRCGQSQLSMILVIYTAPQFV